MVSFKTYKISVDYKDLGTEPRHRTRPWDGCPQRNLLLNIQYFWLSLCEYIQKVLVFFFSI